MKTHIAIKFIRQNYSKKFYCGYCDLQHIMYYTEPTFYNSGVYGWNCDIYTNATRDIAITTGYRNMTGQRIPDELIKKYDSTAKETMKNAINKTYEEVKKELEQNKENFLDELAKL